MLNNYWRLNFINQTGQTMTLASGAEIEVRMTPWKFVNGVFTKDTTIVDDIGQTATIADNAVTEGDTNNNITNKYVGVLGTFKVKHDVDAALGQCRLFFEHCDDDSSWPSDSDDANFSILKLTQVAVLDIDPSAVNKWRIGNFVL